MLRQQGTLLVLDARFDQEIQHELLGTIALGTVFTALAGLFGLAVLADAGLRAWLIGGRWDQLALHALPLVAIYAAIVAWRIRRSA